MGSTASNYPYSGSLKKEVNNENNGITEFVEAPAESADKVEEAAAE